MGKDFNNADGLSLVWAICTVSKQWTRERGKAELVGKDFNNSDGLSHCVPVWAMCTVSKQWTRERGRAELVG